MTEEISKPRKDANELRAMCDKSSYYTRIDVLVGGVVVLYVQTENAALKVSCNGIDYAIHMFGAKVESYHQYPQRTHEEITRILGDGEKPW